MVRPLHRTLATLKCGFSMIPNLLPNGSVTAATLIPSPTAVTGSSGVDREGQPRTGD